MPTNDFLPFCPTDTGSNLLSQSEYAADSQRTIGNQPGVARSKLANKAIRQSTYVTSQVAQFLSNVTKTDVLDDETPDKLLAQFMSAIAIYPPRVTALTTVGSGNFNLTYIFQIVSGSATVGATYTNNAVTFTVKKTVASGLVLMASGNAAPSVSGTLTKASGTGDATITFYAVRAPQYLRVRGVGPGGGGSGAGPAGGSPGSASTATTFGTTLLSAGAGAGGFTVSQTGGAGGAASLGTGPTGLAIAGGSGGGSMVNALNTDPSGGHGGSSAFGGGAGGGQGGNSVGLDGAANSGGGGGGGGAAASQYGGAGGGAGGFFDAIIDSSNVAWATTYPYAVTAGGAGGAGSTGGSAGGAGGSGMIEVTEHYQ